jgi:antiviral helicase SKI2
LPSCGFKILIGINIWILTHVFYRLYKTAIRLGELQAHFNLPISPEEYAQENLKFGLVEVVYEWAKVTFCRK